MFKDKLKKLRKQHNMTQESLAGKLYVSRDLVAKWESGKRYPVRSTAEKIAEIFSVTTDDLLSDDIEAMNSGDELRDCIPDKDYTESESDTDENEIDLLTQTIGIFLRSLSKEDRNLFLRRYYYSDSLEKLQRKTGISKEIISVKLTELRLRLMNYIEKEK